MSETASGGEEARLVAELLAEAGPDVPDDALDDFVYDVAQAAALDDLNATDDEDEQETIIAGSERAASDVNNQGLAAQIRYCLAAGVAVDDLRSALMGGVIGRHGDAD